MGVWRENISAIIGENDLYAVYGVKIEGNGANHR